MLPITVYLQRVPMQSAIQEGLLFLKVKEKNKQTKEAVRYT